MNWYSRLQSSREFCSLFRSQPTRQKLINLNAPAIAGYPRYNQAGQTRFSLSLKRLFVNARIICPAQTAFESVKNFESRDNLNSAATLHREFAALAY